MEIVEVNFLEIEEDEEILDLIGKVIKKCFDIEKITNKNLYVSVILTSSQMIKKINKKYRNIDKETDVLSFPMFEKDELISIIQKDTQNSNILGDIVISLEKVQEQSKQYNHSFEREFSYMLVHGFYHLMGYDHIEENEKQEMRQKEEYILELLNIVRKK